MSHAHTHRSDTHTRRLPPFWLHFVQMLGVMAAGMVGSAAIFLTIVGMDWEQATVTHATTSLLVIAAGMSVPMAAWMLYRGMGWKNTIEMATAMVLPVVPFLLLVWFDVTKTAQCGAYCVIGIAAMLGLMLYRRSEYSMEMVSHVPN
jgi:hypothetical protein